MLKWCKEINYDFLTKYVLFIINPFFGFFYALKRLNTKSSYTILFLFCLLFGISFTPSDNYAGDGKHYIERFNNFRSFSENIYYDELNQFLEFDEGKKDFYVETVSFYLGKLTDNYRYVFFIFAFVFTFFMLKSLRYFTSQSNYKLNSYVIILLYIFTINQIFNINGVRFWTAAWIANYLIFLIILENKKVYYPLIFILPFFHGSYWVFIALIVIFQFLRRLDSLNKILFIVSLFVSSLALELAKTNIDLLPGFLKKSFQFYIDDNYIKERNEVGIGFSSIAKFFNNFLVYIINVLIIFLIKIADIIKKNSQNYNLFMFLLVFGAFTNFTMIIPSVGNRFFMLLYPIIAYLWLYYLYDIKYRKVLYLFPILYIFQFKELIDNYIDVTGIYFYISSPFYIIYEYLL
ncbi:EpsG family protein [Empedobacter falsenii]